MKKIIFLILISAPVNFAQYKTIVFYGTSLTATGKWAANLIEDLRDEYPIIIYFNAAKGGMNSIWGKNNLKELVIDRAPDILTMEFAINDCLNIPNPYYNSTSVSPELSKQNAEDMIDSVKKYNSKIKIFILGMNMPLDSLVLDRNPALERPAWKDYYKIWEDVAREKGVGYIDVTSRWERLDNETLWSYIPDGLHPNEQGGINVIIPSVLPVIENALRDKDFLPVEVTSFSVKIFEDVAVLTWETATETNNLGFDVLRKTEGLNFEKIGFVKGHGSSAVNHLYSFSDKPKSSGIFYYCLRQLDYNGSAYYSKAVRISFLFPDSFVLEQNYPNPFNSTTNISYSIPVNCLVKIKIYDLLGHEILNLLNENKPAGSYNISFNSKLLPSGVYIYELQAGGSYKRKKLIVLK